MIRSAGLFTIAVNSSWQMARFADVIYAGDPAWWDHNQAIIDIPAERWSCYQGAALAFGVNCHPMPNGPFNSGQRAIQFAIERGANRVILLGYDCSVANGSHWHGDHKETKNPNAKRAQIWQGQFAAIELGDCQVINCSRETELKAFPRMKLEDALCSYMPCVA